MHAYIPKHQLEVNQNGEFVIKSRIMCINSYHPVAAVSSDDIPVSPLHMISVSLVSTNISLSSPSISNDHVLASSHTSLSFPLLSDVSNRNLDSSDHEPPVLDDPELLLNLISSGQIDVISDSNTDTHDSIWSSEIDNRFLSPKPMNPSSSSLTSTKRKAVTSHRLLTCFMTLF